MIFSSDCLAGQIYLVTGASSGIGLASAQLISRCGGKVVLVGRNQQRLEEAIQLMQSPNIHSYCIQDITDSDSVVGWIKELAELHGPFSGVFHSAGLEMVKPSKLTKQADLEKLFAASLYGAFGVARAVSLKNIVKDGASIVFMSSVAAVTGQQGMTAYSASKAGIEGLVRSLSCELSSRKIRVNSIAAGAVSTSMHDRLIRNSTVEVIDAYEQSHLLGFGQAEDIANAVVFLLADSSKWITGSSLRVDGGYTVR
ncbi:SDR family NAD(P)-dependent oxidoreductase [Chitinibacter sp. ZOR0017]|uniref:SDR family NAD(P)-dependent oxidoreductase n=1 Tax=Chitinibacter sp. ZOR0017 TaxID=1339254 RepID=UPI0009DF70B6|nr:SDR family oxidoreductase [Chitinibacter sp. ZOR0017]